MEHLGFTERRRYDFSTMSYCRVGILQKTVAILILIPHVSHLLSSCPNLHLILSIPSERLLLTKFENELAVNLVLSVNTICNIYFSYIYVTFIFCNFFSIFISSCIFIFYFNCKSYVFFSIFS